MLFYVIDNIYLKMVDCYSNVYGSQTGEIVSGPDVISRGFVYVRESENLMEQVKAFIREEIRQLEENHVTDWSTIKSTLKDEVRDFIFDRTKRNPMILPIIMEV